jgi:hypothetical protein
MSKLLAASFLERLRSFAQNRGGILRLAAAVALRSPRPGKEKPVVFFNASTRLGDTSLNAGFATVTAWALRMAGVPVVHFVCNAGMSRCVLGTDPDHPEQDPPCKVCARHSRFLTFGASGRFFGYHNDEDLTKALNDLSADQLATFEHRVPEDWKLNTESMPLGALVLPSLRWRLRIHHLQDDEPTRHLYREFILSAWNVARGFSGLLKGTDPQAVVVFNGQFFPEATVRWLCLQNDIRVVTHEVGLQPLTGYFTTGEATAYPIHIPDEFELNDEQNSRLDAYLEKRFQGRFSMAGVQFWPEMKGLDEVFLKKAAGFKQIVPVFTNVIFDTSQPHSNVVFPDMFTWLDMVLETIKQHPETLFVLRAHPDESRPGKAARESVADWVAHTGAAELSNLVFVPSDEFISSYELIQRAKFVMIYNSTIGLEASIIGKAVLCAGKARFTQYPTVFFPDSQLDYRKRLDFFLGTDSIPVPREFQLNARRFLYYQVFRTSLPFGDFLETSTQRGYIRFKRNALARLCPERSSAIRAVLDGIVQGGNFLLEEG